MRRLPTVTGKQLVGALKKRGYVVSRQRGSHVQMRRVDEEGRISTFPVPVHAGKTIKPGTLKGILRLAGLSDIELKKLL